MSHLASQRICSAIVLSHGDGRSALGGSGAEFDEARCSTAGDGQCEPRTDVCDGCQCGVCPEVAHIRRGGKRRREQHVGDT